MEVKFLLFVFVVFSLCVSLSSSKRNHGSNTNQYQDQDDEFKVVAKFQLPNHHHDRHENYVELDDIQDEKCNRCKGYTDIDSSSSSSSSIGSTMGSTGNEGSSSSDISISSDKESIDKLDHQDYQRDVCGCKFGYYGKLCRERELRYQQSFIAHGNQFNKIYTANELYIRYELFKDNSRYVNQHNKKNDTTYQLGMNIFSDISPDEFLSTYLANYNMIELNKIIPQTESKQPTHINKLSSKLAAAPTLPESIDWRNYLPPIKNQGSCACGYAFSSIGSIEAQLSKKTGKVVSLSEQEIVDCSESWGNNGCKSGWMPNVYNYAKANDGVQYDANYRYQSRVQSCTFGYPRSGPIYGYANVSNENDMTNALAVVGPMAIVVQAGIRSFQMYSGGIYNDPICGTGRFDHSVLNVGYGNSGGINYYLIRNSWGESWGEQGHMRIVRTTTHLTDYGFYPII